MLGVLLGTFFAHNKSDVLVQIVFRTFLAFLIFDLKWPFSKGYSLCVVANFGHFQNALIFWILVVFWSSFFAHNKSNVLVRWFFTPFSHFQFLTQTDHFAKAIYSLCVVANFGHFENALIFWILGVFWSRFLHTTNRKCSYERFSHPFGIFNFWLETSILQRP